MANLLNTVRQVVNKAGGFEKVAELCGYKNPNILRNQLSETNFQHKLGAIEIERIIAVCKPHSIEIAQVFANESESILIQMPKANNQKARMMELILKAGKAFGDVSSQLLESLDPKSEDGIAISQNEFERIEEKSYMANRAFQDILHYTRTIKERNQ